MGFRAVVAVDVQKGFFDGALGFDGAKELDEKIAVHLEYEAMQGSIILATKDTHDKNYLETQEGKRLPIEHCIRGSEDWEFYGKTKGELETNAKIVVTKGTFGSDALLRALRRLDEQLGSETGSGITEIEFIGVVTNMCVISNAVMAKVALPEARIIINAELCHGLTEELHNMALKVMQSMQMDIINWKE